VRKKSAPQRGAATQIDYSCQTFGTSALVNADANYLMQIKIGCCGFPVAKERYYKYFDLVEIQQTFYQLPQEKTVYKWREQAPPDFEFTLKAWQLITHPPSSPTYRRLKQVIPEARKEDYGFFKATEEVFKAWEETEKIAQILKARIIVFQCPASFRPAPENKGNLEKFFKAIKRKNFIFVWEPRGRWEREEISNLCEKLNLLPCLDPFKSEIPPEAAEKPFPGKVGYFRLHGKAGYRYKYTDSDLKELKALAKGFNTVYFMFNNVHMFEDALRFKQKIIKRV